MGRSIGRSRSNRRKLKSKKKIKTATKQHMKVATKKQIEVKQAKLQIIEINDHCLIKIFDLLSTDDLVSVSMASPHFESSASFVFKKRFAREFVVVNDRMPVPRALHQSPCINIIDEAPSDLLLLKSFGHLIKRLRVDYSGVQRFSIKLEQSVMKYCAKSVTEIIFTNADRFAFNQIEKKPFESVREVAFIKCALGQFIFEFNKWFPNARLLEFLKTDVVTVTDTKCIEQNLPKLEHLGIFNEMRHRDSVCDAFSNRNLEATIELNSQLISLTLVHENIHRGIKITPTLLAFINEKLPLLDSLHLHIFGWTHEYVFPEHQVHFKNLRKMKFLVNVAEAFSHIEISTRLPAKIKLISNKKLNHHCAVFLSKNKHWKEIAFHGAWESYQSFESVKMTLKSFSLLSCVRLNADGLNGKQNEVLTLLTECKFLKRLKICFSVLPRSQQIRWEYYDYSDRKDERGMFVSMCNCLLMNWKDFRLQSNIGSNEGDIDDQIDSMRAWTNQLKIAVGHDFRDSVDERDETRILKDRLYQSLDILGKLFISFYNKAFVDKSLSSSWNADYAKIGREFTLSYCAIYENKDLER